MIPCEEITAVILCGGAARRMGGAQKALLDLHGQPLISWMLMSLAGQVGTIMLSANDELLRYAALGYPIVTDQRVGLGPLGGLHSALSAVSTPWVFVCPGDMPYMDGQVVTRLREHIGTATAAYPCDGTRAHYLCALIRTDCFAALDEYLDAGHRSVHGFLTSLSATRVDMPDLQNRFANVNDAETLADLRLRDKPTPGARPL